MFLTKLGQNFEMFYLKGNRKYLHSTDIISYLFAKYKKIKSLDIKFYKIITGNPRLKIINKKVSSIKYDCVANLDLENKRLISLIFSGTKKKIVQSYSYNEELLYPYFKILKKKISLKKKIDWKIIDLLISMSKFYCEKKIGRKKWLVYRVIIDNNFIIKNFKSVELILMKEIKKKIYVFEIILDKKSYGSIYYTY